MVLFISVEVSALSHPTFGLHDQVVKNGLSRLIPSHCVEHHDVLLRSSLANSAMTIALRRPSCSDCHLSCVKASTNGATRPENARLHCHSSLATTSGSSGGQRS